MAGETIRDLVIRLKVEQQGTSLRVPGIDKAQKEADKAAKESAKEQEKIEKEKERVTLNRIKLVARMQKEQADKQAEVQEQSKKMREKEEADLEAFQKKTQENAIKTKESLMASGEGAFHLVRGLTLLTANEKDLAQLVRTLAMVQGAYDVFKGTRAVIEGVTVAVAGLRAAQTAQSAASSAAAASNTATAASNIAVGTTAFGAALGVAALGIALAAIPIAAVLIGGFILLSQWLKHNREEFNKNIKASDAFWGRFHENIAISIERTQQDAQISADSFARKIAGIKSVIQFGNLREQQEERELDTAKLIRENYKRRIADEKKLFAETAKNIKAAKEIIAVKFAPGQDPKFEERKLQAQKGVEAGKQLVAEGQQILQRVRERLAKGASLNPSQVDVAILKGANSALVRRIEHEKTLLSLVSEQKRQKEAALQIEQKLLDQALASNKVAQAKLQTAILEKTNAQERFGLMAPEEQVEAFRIASLKAEDRSFEEKKRFAELTGGAGAKADLASAAQQRAAASGFDVVSREAGFDHSIKAAEEVAKKAKQAADAQTDEFTEAAKSFDKFEKNATEGFRFITKTVNKLVDQQIKFQRDMELVLRKFEAGQQKAR
jgi:hypothetical protein